MRWTTPNSFGNTQWPTSRKLLALLLIQEMLKWEGSPKINPEIHRVLGRWLLVRHRQAHNKVWLRHIKSIISLSLEGGEQNFHPCTPASSTSFQPCSFLHRGLTLLALNWRHYRPTAYPTTQAALAQGPFPWADLRAGQDPWLLFGHSLSVSKTCHLSFQIHLNSTQLLISHWHQCPSSHLDSIIQSVSMPALGKALSFRHKTYSSLL